MRMNVHVLHSRLRRPVVEDIGRQRALAEGVEVVHELIVRAVVEEAQRAAAARRVVVNLSNHHTGIVEEQFVADTYLAGGLYEHIPQMRLLVELPEYEDLYLRVRLLLRAVETRGEDLRIVENERVTLAEIVEHIAEVKVLTLNRFTLVVLFEKFNLASSAMKHHQARLITTVGAVGLLLAVFIHELTLHAVRVQSHKFLWQVEIEL